MNIQKLLPSPVVFLVLLLCCCLGSIKLLSQTWGNVSQNHISPDTALTLSKQLSLTTSFIQTTYKDSKEVMSSGTGFLYMFEYDGMEIPALITNKHVVAGNGDFIFDLKFGDPRNLKSIKRKRYIIPRSILNKILINHPNDEDLCAVVISAVDFGFKPNDKTCNVFFHERDILPETEEYAIEPLNELHMIGYPAGIIDTVHGFPVVRSGKLASPLTIDWNGKPEFLTDLETFPGSSGSPVYVYDNSFATPDGGYSFGSRFYLVGISFAVNLSVSSGLTEPIIIDGVRRGLRTYTQSPNGIGLCVKAKEILILQKILERKIKAEKTRSVPSEFPDKN